MASLFPLRRTPVAFASLALLASAAHAQTATTLQPVTITGKGDPVVGVAGHGDTPLSRSPFQASILSREQMRDNGVTRLADVVRIDASVSDAYNTEGYWDYLTVRGFVIDNKYNYRRDGLPINAETAIALDNKERVEILKGTSGIQAGTSSPGGLANFVVKRPTSQPLRDVLLSWRESGSLLGAVDISQRFGTGDALGVRLNAAAEKLDPKLAGTQGDRHMLALAGEWRVSADSLLEAEVETSRRSQPSVPGFSLLGSVVPRPVNSVNLNNQPWSQPVVLAGNTASLRFTHRLGADWRVVAHAATQRLVSDDRIAFPYGCGAEGNFDRYCSDGSFDLYDYRSDNERRSTRAAELALHGKFATGGITHAVSAGALKTSYKARFEGQAFNYVGSGNVEGTVVTPPDPTLGPGSANVDERSTEFFVRDAITLGQGTTAWLGLRHTRLDRSYEQDFTTPSIALSHEYAGGTLVYASWGQGVESLVTPRLPAYGAAAGQPLRPLKSRQFEIGAKGRFDNGSWNLAWFDIDRPAATDTGSEYFIDGSWRHRGLEASLAYAIGRWTLQGSGQFLNAERQGGQDPSANGKKPTNVPERTLKLQLRHELAAVPGLSAMANFTAESERQVLPDNSVRIPGWSRLDASVRYLQPTSFGRLVWRAGVDNLLDKKAWRESPFQFGHAYLFPTPARALRVSVEAAL